MQAELADLNLAEIGGADTQQARIPGERDAERATVLKFDPHLVGIEADLGGLGEIVMPYAFDLGAGFGDDAAEHHQRSRVGASNFVSLRLFLVYDLIKI